MYLQLNFIDGETKRKRRRTLFNWVGKRQWALNFSSVARGGGGLIAPPIGMSTKMQNEKNTTFLALLRLFYALEWTK